ncbi:hypothetical protein H4I95_09011 [Botrytis cinerea]
MASHVDGEATDVIIEHEVDLSPGEPGLFSASTSLVACLKVPGITRLLTMQTYKSQQQLMNMVDGIKLDLQKLASKAVGIKSRDPPDSNVHFGALKVEGRALACNIKYPDMRLGFESAMGFSICYIFKPRREKPTEKGSQTRIKAYRAVPDDPKIFRLYRDGRMNAIRNLFDEGLASLRGTDYYGIIALIAAFAGQLSRCKFLVNEGTDLEAWDIQNHDLGSHACGTWSFG